MGWGAGVTQQHGGDLHRAGPAERTELIVVPDLGGIEVLRARFIQHSFEPHFHDTFLIGMTLAGAEQFSHRGHTHISTPGMLRFHNPGEIHAGAPAGKSWCYQALYPGVDLMTRIAEERLGRASRMPDFRQVMARDEGISLQVDRLFRSLRGNTGPLERESRLVITLARLLERYGNIGALPDIGASAVPAVQRAQEFLVANATRDVDLDSVAAAAEMSRYQLLASFKQVCGVTPAAFHAQCRALRARQLLQSGQAPVSVAARCGYTDAADLGRAFKRYFGLSPTQYRAAVWAG